jgi:hypothetical protein
MDFMTQKTTLHSTCSKINEGDDLPIRAGKSWTAAKAALANITKRKEN